ARRRPAARPPGPRPRRHPGSASHSLHDGHCGCLRSTRWAAPGGQGSGNWARGGAPLAPGRRPLDRAGTIGAVSIEPDTKDWTWVIEEPCGQCGFDPAAVARADLPELIHENTRGWYDVLADADFAVRPAPHVWSRLEYACHVRDVH